MGLVYLWYCYWCLYYLLRRYAYADLGPKDYVETLYLHFFMANECICCINASHSAHSKISHGVESHIRRIPV